jgi:ribosome-binding protein aMBF1 (putative translation factor)
MKPGMVVHTYNHSIQEARGQPGLNGKALSQKRKKKLYVNVHSSIIQSFISQKTENNSTVN